MITKLSTNVATYFAYKNVYSRDEVQVYVYGFELLISTILNGLGILLISLLMGVFLEAMLFCLAFIPLRVAAGGYHAKHHWSCFLAINLTFLCFTIINKNMSGTFMTVYSLVIVMISSLVIWVLSPVEADNKPLSQGKKDVLRNRSIMLASLNMALALILFIIPSLHSTLILYYLSGFFAASCSLVVAAFTTNNKTQKNM